MYDVRPSKGVWPNMPGFAASVTPNSIAVNTTWTYVPSDCAIFVTGGLQLCSHVYYLSWPLGFCISAAIWMILNTVWPPPGPGEKDEDCIPSSPIEREMHNIPRKTDYDIEQAAEELCKRN